MSSQVCAGHAHSLLLDADGQVFACGLNDRGQCGIENRGEGSLRHVAPPSLVSGLPPRAVRAMAASPFLSCFEVETDGESGGEGEAGALGQGLPSELAGPGASSPALWLAGDVEAFNIPGTVTSAGGLQFMPSCYQWQ
jgi:hypothetical protein